MKQQSSFIKLLHQVCLALLVVNFLFLLGCKKWLDEKPSAALSTPETLNDLQAMLDNYIVMNQEQTPSFGEGSSDDFFLLQSSYDNRNPSNQRAYTWEYYNHDNANDWRESYTPIYYANLCLDMLKDIPLTNDNAALWNNVKGSALFFRGYYFLGLVWTYSKAFHPDSSSTDLGIALRKTSDFNSPTTRATVEQTYNQIIDDLNQASNLLPTDALHVMRPSRPAAFAALARTYLSMRNYDSAGKYSNMCLQLRNQLMNYNSDPDVIANFAAGVSPFKKFNKETIFYSEISLNYNLISPASAKVDTTLVGLYDFNDLRRLAFFINQGNSHYRFKGNYSQSNSVPLFSGLATDEIFLIRAECYARAGNISSSLSDLNKLLSNRYSSSTFVAFSSGSASVILDRILLERRKELLFRGLRWMDIKRLNREGRNIFLKRFINNKIYTLPPGDPRFALPIPEQIINLTGVQQNPGWL